MKKVIFFTLLFCTTLVYADILLPPTKMEKLKGLMIYKIKQKLCPSDKPLYGVSNIDGKNIVGCYPCDYPIDVGAHLMGDMCSKICPNRYDPRKNDEVEYDRRRYCRLTLPPSKEYEFSERITMAPGSFYLGGWIRCPLDKPLFVQSFLEDGKCQPCEYEDHPYDVQFGCDKCPNRFKHDNGCFQKCPNERPILGLRSGKCFTCDYDGEEDDFVLGCARCKDKPYSVTCEDI